MPHAWLEPVANGVPLSETASAELLQEIDDLVTTGVSQSMESALQRVENLFSDEGGAQANRVLYVLTDLREIDWPATGGGVFDTLTRIAGKAAGCYVVDLGKDGAENLSIEAIVPREKAFVTGAPAEFDVIVRNYGQRPVNDVGVKLGAEEGLSVERSIDRIEPGQAGDLKPYGDYLMVGMSVVPVFKFLQSLREHTTMIFAGADACGVIDSPVRVWIVKQPDAPVPLLVDIELVGSDALFRLLIQIVLQPRPTGKEPSLVIGVV